VFRSQKGIHPVLALDQRLKSVLQLIFPEGIARTIAHPSVKKRSFFQEQKIWKNWDFFLFFNLGVHKCSPALGFAFRVNVLRNIST